MAPEFFKCTFNPTFLDCITYRPDTLTASGDKVHFNIGSGDIWTTLSKADKRILPQHGFEIGVVCFDETFLFFKQCSFYNWRRVDTNRA